MEFRVTCVANTHTLVDERTPFSDLEIRSKTSEFTSCVSEQLDEILKDLI